jgi:hypothetical protein
MQYANSTRATNGLITTVYDGKVTERGGGEKVLTCGACGDLCTADEKCKSYECSPTTLECSLNNVTDPNTFMNNLSPHQSSTKSPSGNILYSNVYD